MAAEWYKEQPTNRNFLSPVGFQFDLELFSGVDFFCQSVNLPDISMPVAEIPNKFRSIPLPGSGGVQFGDLNVQFLIDEDLKNYMSIQNWIRDFGLTEGHASGLDKTSRGRIQVLTSNFNGNFYVNFEELFPIALTGVNFDATPSDIDYVTATAVFKYTRYNVQTETGTNL